MQHTLMLCGMLTKKRLANLFNITDPTCMTEIKIGSRGEREVDSGRLLEQMAEAMKMINQLKPKQLRIIGLGRGSAVIVTDSLEYLIRKWEMPLEEKHVQFISLGESSDF